MPAPGVTSEDPAGSGPVENSPDRESGESLTGVSKLAHRLALATLCVAYLGVVVGGIVTSTKSGRVDKNWPSFDGELLPSLAAMGDNPGLLVEHGHRLIMGLVGVLALLACIATLKKEKRHQVRKLSCGVFFLWLLPAILGGLTVLLRLPPEISILHVGMAMIFLCAAALLAIVTAPGWIGEKTRLKMSRITPICPLALFAVISIYVQIVLGALASHARPYPGGGGEVLQDAGNIVHIIWAFAVFTGIVLLTGKILGLRKAERLLHPALGLLLLLFMQVFLGFFTFINQPDPAKVVDEASGFPVTGTFVNLRIPHQALGVLILMLSLLVCARAYRIRALSLAEPEAVA